MKEVLSKQNKLLPKNKIEFDKIGLSQNLKEKTKSIKQIEEFSLGHKRDKRKCLTFLKSRKRITKVFIFLNQ